MKKLTSCSLVNSIRRLLLFGVALVLSLNLLQAQTAVVGGFNTDLGPVPAAPGGLPSLIADADGLAQVPFDQLPRFGTFWLVMSGPGGNIAPFPCPIDTNFPVYDITGEGRQFLVDGSSGGPGASSALRFGPLATSSGRLTALTKQATAVSALIENIQGIAAGQQTRTMARAMGDASGPPGFGDGGDGGGGDWPGFGIIYTYPTNGLWLQMVGVTNGLAYVNLHCVPNLDSVYQILAKPDLSVPGWTVQTEVFPPDTNQNVVTFTVPMWSPTNLFIWARDMTGIDSDGDGVPDWWSWLYWGTANLPDTNLDYSGDNLTFSQDYSNNIVPTVFQFASVAVANNYVNATPATVQLNVAGDPYYMAVLVDDANSADAVWYAYTSPNLTVNLGATEGWHNIWIGLRGHADAPASAVWVWKRLKLDYSPPQLVITGPTNGTVNQPVIQLTGYSPENLSRISYDLSNASGVVTNQQVLVNDQFYNTGTAEFTTNYFQGFDIPLTNGVNTFTLHAADLAGNMATLMTNFTLIYSNKPAPVVQLLWPQNGMWVCGSSFIWNGSVSDPTATVTAQLVDANGATNVFNAAVGRDGKFWVQNLPLNSGTNVFTLTVTDIANNVVTTNLTVIQGNAGLTIDPIPHNQTTVTGGINASGYTVWVNGIQATITGNRWEADNVPIPPNSSLVQVRAIYGGGQ